jgi:hypothetical protein
MPSERKSKQGRIHPPPTLPLAHTSCLPACPPARPPPADLVAAASGTASPTVTFNQLITREVDTLVVPSERCLQQLMVLVPLVLG